jgi:hypothetical protein
LFSVARPICCTESLSRSSVATALRSGRCVHRALELELDLRAAGEVDAPVRARRGRTREPRRPRRRSRRRRTTSACRRSRSRIFD